MTCWGLPDGSARSPVAVDKCRQPNSWLAAGDYVCVVELADTELLSHDQPASKMAAAAKKNTNRCVRLAVMGASGPSIDRARTPSRDRSTYLYREDKVGAERLQTEYLGLVTDEAESVRTITAWPQSVNRQMIHITRRNGTGQESNMTCVTLSRSDMSTNAVKECRKGGGLC